MFSPRYILAEFRRRRGRAILTALGLGLGVALVIVVGALSNGLDKAQDEVLAPLAGVGTDISVTRPLRIEEGEPIQLGPNGNLTDEEQALLQAENIGGGRIPFNELGDPGEPFEVDRFVTFELSFPEEDTAVVQELDGVQAVAGQLTLNLTHIEGEVPEAGIGGGPGAGGGPGGGGARGGFDVSSAQVSGTDLTQADLAAVTQSEVVEGAYFAGDGSAQAVVNEAYAGREGVSVGDSIDLAGAKYDVVGIASSPLGGQASDIYIELGALQKASEREGRVNRLRVRAAGGDAVAEVAAGIESNLAGTRATTASDLADRVEGSLTDAKDLARTLGTALAVVALLAAVGLATLLTLNSVAKRTRELGTLRAIGWSKGRVVRQIAGESVAIGAIGAVAGVVLGLLGAQLAEAFFPSLEASLAPAGNLAAGGGPGGGRFGLGAVSDAPEQAVSVGAPIDVNLLALGVVLAILGGVIAGMIAGLRAARLKPSEALRTVE